MNEFFKKREPELESSASKEFWLRKSRRWTKWVSLDFLHAALWGVLRWTVLQDRCYCPCFILGETETEQLVHGCMSSQRLSQVYIPFCLIPAPMLVFHLFHWSTFWLYHVLSFHLWKGHFKWQSGHTYGLCYQTDLNWAPDLNSLSCVNLGKEFNIPNTTICTIKATSLLNAMSIKDKAFIKQICVVSCMCPLK